ncbi:MAG: methyltransferase domain-containing protein [Nitrospirae bacterium]|nr:MAG: methyltransferase domain-containing protein [Nitrospirota bacterium]
MDQKQGTGPSPLLFFQAVNGYQRTAALKTAIELDLFTAISENHRTPADLARRCEASERGIRMLADYLTCAGFLTKEHNAYALTPDSATFLNRHSPAYLGPTLDFLLSSPLLDGFRHLTEAVRKGGTALSDHGTVAPEHPEWVTFARSMVPMMRGPAEWMANWVVAHVPECRRVLDVAAGHGIFGIELAKRLPKAEITALDWANVLRVAQENARVAGIQDRYRTIAGSAFEAQLEGHYDLVLLTNFLHHFDMATCEFLLRKISDVMTERGYVLTLEFIPNEDRVSPPAMAEFCLIMLATTPSGDAYTFSEYEQMFQRAGFSSSELLDVPSSNQRLIVTRKR